MRKLIALSVLLVLAINVMATEFVIVRNGEQSTIYRMDVGYNGNTYLGVFPINNPSVDMLIMTGLPSNLWGQLKESDGIYDTRLITANELLTVANAQLYTQNEEINNLESDKSMFRFFTILLFLIILGIFFIWIFNQGPTRRY